MSSNFSFVSCLNAAIVNMSKPAFEKPPNTNYTTKVYPSNTRQKEEKKQQSLGSNSWGKNPWGESPWEKKTTQSWNRRTSGVLQNWRVDNHWSTR